MSTPSSKQTVLVVAFDVVTVEMVVVVLFVIFLVVVLLIVVAVVIVTDVYVVVVVVTKLLQGMYECVCPQNVSVQEASSLLTEQ